MRSSSQEEVINSLKADKESRIGCRFPCRVILLHSRDAYLRCVDSLKLLCDRTVTADELFSGIDIMPKYDSLLSKVDPGEWLLLPGVSEYLRLFSSSEKRSGRFAKLWHTPVDAITTGRIIIPLWNADTLWFDRMLDLSSDERQNDYVWSIPAENTTPERLSIKLMSSDFETYISQLSEKYSLIVGLKEWYCEMAVSSRLLYDYCLLTRQARCCDNSSGDITISVIRDRFSFVSGNLEDGQVLKRNELSESALDELFDEALKNKSLNKAILSRFGLAQFDPYLMVSGWEDMPEGKKELVKLWYRQNPDDSYICHCFESSELCDLKKHVLLDIFDLMLSHPEWIPEYCKLTDVMQLKKDDAFFSKLDEIPIYEDRLPFLSSYTTEERVYIISFVGQWLKTDPECAFKSSKLKRLYPALSWYLSRLPDEVDDCWSRYLSEYKKYKLSNTLPQVENTTVSPDTLPYRYSLLNQKIVSDTVILWIDAMGFEYLPLLYKTLEDDKNGHLTYIALAQATLPSETKFNEQWKQMNVPYEKLDKLDKLAHKGVIDEPDYYACIEEQLSFFEKVRSKIDKLLEKYRRVIITGDHGTSRLAARLFHKRDGITLPSGAISMSHGRYCLLPGKETISYDFVKEATDADGKHYLVITSYDHFSQSGFAAGGDDDNAIFGEVHGGASPEEIVVPVVVFDKNGQLPLTVKWKNDNNQVRLKRGSVKAELELGRAVTSLKVRVGNHDAKCSSDNGIDWTIVFDGITAGTYNPSIIADSQLLSIDKQFIVKSAIGGDGDL